MNHHRFFALLGIFATTAAAQQIAYFPSDHDMTEGATSISPHPVAAGIARTLCYYGRRDMTVPNNGAISRIGFRSDRNANDPGHRVQMSIDMGHSNLEIDALSSTFANNYNGSPTNVLAQRIVDLPALVRYTGTGPNPQQVFLPADRTFVHDRSQSLLVDFRVFANDNSNQAWTYRFDGARALPIHEQFGTACMTSGNQTPRLTTSGGETNRTWSISLASAPASSAGVLIVGLSNTNWGAIPLPLNLGLLGAPNCFLHVDIALTLPIRTNTSGGVSVSARVPDTFFMHRKTAYTQMAVGDLFAQGGLVTSNGASTRFAIAPQIGVVQRLGDANGSTGTVQAGNGITLFEY